jgi:hypothetical protein
LARIEPQSTLRSARDARLYQLPGDVETQPVAQLQAHVACQALLDRQPIGFFRHPGAGHDGVVHRCDGAVAEVELALGSPVGALLGEGVRSDQLVVDGHQPAPDHGNQS